MMDSSGLRASSPAAREDCCRVLRDSLAGDDRYALRFDNADASIYERVIP